MSFGTSANLGHEFVRLRVLPDGGGVPADVPAAVPAPAAAPPAPAAAVFPTATFADFLTTGPRKCCDSAKLNCFSHLGVVKAGDPSTRNGVNLMWTVNDHQPGVEYSFVQVIQTAACKQNTAALGGTWNMFDHDDVGTDDSPFAAATCPVPDAKNQIGMHDAPGFPAAPGSPATAGRDQITFRMHATDWVIAREKGKAWKKISDTFQWHTTSGLHRDGAGNWALTPGRNTLGKGIIKIGGCPPP